MTTESESNGAKHHHAASQTGLAELATQIGKPAYEDLVQPAAKQLGKSLETVLRLVNVALMPLILAVYGAQELESFAKKGIAEAFEEWGTDTNNLKPPAPYVGIPAIQGLVITATVEELRLLYSRLIASSMDPDRAATAHPSYAEIIRQLRPEEARVLTQLRLRGTVEFNTLTIQRPYNQPGSGIPFLSLAQFGRLNLVAKDDGLIQPEAAYAYVANLVRLGLVVLPTNPEYVVGSAEHLFDPFAGETPRPGRAPIGGHRVRELVNDHPEVSYAVHHLEPGDLIRVLREVFVLSEFGLAFCETCVPNRY